MREGDAEDPWRLPQERGRHLVLAGMGVPTGQGRKKLTSSDSPATGHSAPDDVAMWECRLGEDFEISRGATHSLFSVKSPEFSMFATTSKKRLLVGHAPNVAFVQLDPMPPPPVSCLRCRISTPHTYLPLCLALRVDMAPLGGQRKHSVIGSKTLFPKHR